MALKYQTSMAYDTGSTNLIVFHDEVQLLASHPIFPLQATAVQTSMGLTHRWQLRLQFRVLADNNQRVLRNWHDELATIIVRTSPSAIRLSSKSLNSQFFVCERPSDRRLFVARHKTPLNKMMYAVIRIVDSQSGRQLTDGRLGTFTWVLSQQHAAIRQRKFPGARMCRQKLVG